MLWLGTCDKYFIFDNLVIKQLNITVVFNNLVSILEVNKVHERNNYVFTKH